MKQGRISPIRGINVSLSIIPAASMRGAGILLARSWYYDGVISQKVAAEIARGKALENCVDSHEASECKNIKQLSSRHQTTFISDVGWWEFKFSSPTEEYKVFIDPYGIQIPASDIHKY